MVCYEYWPHSFILGKTSSQDFSISKKENSMSY
jgi:hypothetical protein